MGRAGLERAAWGLGRPQSAIGLAACRAESMMQARAPSTPERMQLARTPVTQHDVRAGVRSVLRTSSGKHEPGVRIASTGSSHLGRVAQPLDPQEQLTFPARRRQRRNRHHARPEECVRRRLDRRGERKVLWAARGCLLLQKSWFRRRVLVKGRSDARARADPMRCGKCGRSPDDRDPLLRPHVACAEACGNPHVAARPL